MAGLGNKDQEFWKGLREVGCISNVGNVGRYREVERGEGKVTNGLCRRRRKRTKRAIKEMRKSNKRNDNWG